MIKRIHPRIKDAIISLLQPYELHFYYFFLCRIDWYEWDKCPTMCAGVVSMRLAVMYNNDFVDTLNDDELRYLLLHELMHLLHNHSERGISLQKDKANFAMDGIINDIIDRHYIKTRNGHTIASMPKFGQSQMEEMITKIKGMRQLSAKEEKEIREYVGKDTGCRLDPNYKGPLALEPYYEWLIAEHEKSKKGEPNQLSPDSKMMLDNADIKEMMMDAHAQLSECDQDIKNQLTAEAVAKARLEVSKTRGTVPGDVEETLGLLLAPPKRNNLRLLQRSMSAIKGRTKEKSWKRLNRRVPGLKGKVGISNQINAGLDVSGSMYGTFDIVLRELFKDGYEINLVQIDTQVQKVEKVTAKSQLKNFKLKGGGGTCLQPFVDHVLNPKNGLNKHATVLLTDGYCDHLDFKGTRGQFLILTTQELVQYKNGPNVKQLKIEH